MKKIYRFGKSVFVSASVIGGAVLVPALAHAEGEFTMTPPALDMTLLGTLATAILGGLAAIWLLRKVIKTMNKS